MIRWKLPALLAATSLIWSIPGYDRADARDKGATTDVDRTGFPHAVLSLPSPFPDRVKPALTLTVGPTGEILSSGQIITPTELSNVLAALDQPSGTVVGLSVPGDLALNRVLPMLQRLESGQVDAVELDGNEAFRTFGSTKSVEEAGLVPASFRGETARYELPVYVSWAGNGDGCATAVGDRVLGSTDLFESSFELLDGWVQDAGGLEGILSTWDSYPVFATIQSAPETPWRCIGGAIYNLQAAGFPSIRIELVAGA